MASGTITPVQAPPAPPKAADQVEQYIEGRLRHTQRQLQRVDLSSGLITLLCGGLVLLLVAALADHWLVFGGLGFGGRLLFWLAIVVAGGLYAWRRIVPPLARRISPIYAAHTIERSRPTLKNSLINFLLFRRERQVVPEVVFYALEDRAARDIAAVPNEAGVDAAPVIRRGYLLAAALGVFCLYLVLSPKNPLTSAARVLLPWAKIAPPTRVTITDLKPGENVERFHGDGLEVSATVKGIRDGEPVLLYYSTADGQVHNQAIPLTATEGNQFRASLPPGSLGLQQDCTYRLVAGDCKSDTFRVTVLVAPVITVEKVRYEYPSYTEIPNRIVEREGDIRAIENTKVTLYGTANYDIQRAEIDLNCTGKPGPKMLVEGKNASGQITLRMSRGADAKPDFESYQLRFVDVHKRPNPRPIRHRIEIVPDLPPEVQLLLPKEEELIVPLDGQVEMRVTAQDPDFALRQVAVRAECDGKDLKLKPLLSRPMPGKPHAGPFEGTLVFEPRKLSLKAGDQVTYWAEAEDNRDFEANRATTTKRRIIIAKPAQQPEQKPDPNQAAQPKPDQGEGPKSEPGQENNADPNNKPTEPQPGEAPEKGNAPENKPGQTEGMPKENGEGQNPQPETDPAQTNDAANGANAAGSKEAGANSGGQPGDTAAQDQPQERVNPETDLGEAIDKLRADAREQQKKQGKASPQPGGEGAKQPQGGQEKQPGEPSDDATGNKNEGQSPNAGSKSEQKLGEGAKQPKPNEPGGPQQPNEAGGQKNEAGGQKNDANGQKNDGTGQKNEAGNPKPGAEKNDGGNTPKNGNEPNKGANEPKNGNNPQGGQQPNNGQNPGGANPADQKPGEGKAPNRPDPEQSGSRPTNQPGGNPQGQPQPGAPGTEGNKDGKTQPNPNGQTDPKGNGGAPKPDQTGGKPDAPQPGGNEQANASGSKPEKGATPSEPAAGAPKGGNPDTKPQDAGSEKPQQGTANPKDNQTGNKSDQANRTEGQMNQPNQSPGTGGASQDPKGSPEAQGDNKKREQTPQPGGSAENKDGAESPTISEKESKNSKGQTGDQSGGGGKGGGQQSPNPGQGTPGTGTDSESGGAQSPERGPGEAGTKAGNEVATEKKTGNSTQRRDGEGSTSGERQASDKIGKNELPDKETPGGKSGGQANDNAGGQPGSQPSDQPGKSRGPGIPQTGGKPSETADSPPAGGVEPGADEGNLEFARKETNLALSHLKDEMRKDKSAVLDRLGWTPDDARRFLEKWEQMQRAAREPGPNQKAAKKQLDDALKSLGLKPRGTEIRGAATPRDKLDGLRENIRFTPSAEWAELVKEYQRSVASGGR